MRRLLQLALVAAALATPVACASAEARKGAYLANGNRYASQGRYREAIIEYRNALRQDPRFGEARYRLAEAYLRTDQPHAALPEYVRAADLLPDNVHAQIQAVALLLVAGRFEDARARIEQVLTKDPTSVAGHILLGNALAGLQDLDRAVTQIQEAIDLDPNRSGSYMNLAALLFARRRPLAAEETFKKATEMAPHQADAHLGLANFYWASGQIAEAELSLTRAIHEEPRHPAANQALATFYLATNRAADAEAYFKAVADVSGTTGAKLALADYYLMTKRAGEAMPLLERLATDPRAFAASTARIAALQHTDGRRDEAHRTIDATLAKAPNDKLALLIKARMLLTENRLDEALFSVKAAVAVDPRWAPAHYTLGSIYVAQHDLTRAQDAFAQVLRLNPHAVPAQMQLSQLHLQRGRFQTSAELAQEVTASQPDNALAHLLLVRSLMGQGDLDEAEARMKALLERAPTFAPVHAQMGTLMLLKQDQASARRYFTRAAELDPTLLEPLTGLITLDLSAHEFAEARARLETQLAARPRDPALLFLASGFYSISGDDSSAERCLRIVIDVEPWNLKAYGQLALLYYRQHKLPQALVEFEELARRQPKSVAPETMLGMIFQVSDRPVEAQPHYEHALNIDPTAPVAANNLAWIYAETGGSLDLALQLAQTAKLQLPEIPEVDDTLGWIYYKKEMVTLAVSRLEEAVRKAPGRAVYHYHLGLAYAKQGNRDKARESLEKALSLDPNQDEAAEAHRALATLGRS